MTARRRRGAAAWWVPLGVLVAAHAGCDHARSGSPAAPPPADAAPAPPPRIDAAPPPPPRIDAAPPAAPPAAPQDPGYPIELVDAPAYQGVLRLDSQWPATRDDVTAFEAALTREVARRPLSLPLTRYVRGYFGALDGKRRRLDVYLTCEPGVQWKRGIFPETLGGGDCFVHVTWDKATGRIVEFRPNDSR